MDLAQLRHVILELGERFDLKQVYVVGSSAVFASLPSTTDVALTATRDVDLALPLGEALPPNQIEFVLGEGSDFDVQHGYYAQAVDLSTPKYAPAGWQARAVELRVGRTTARCMAIHDLALAKYGAGREKDLEFTRALSKLGAVSRDTLERLLESVDTTTEHRALIAARIGRDFARQ